MMLNLDHLTVSYGNNRVLDNMELSLPLQCIHGLVGLNGAGKTTLLNTIAGYKKQEEGTILINGAPLKRKDLAYLETEQYYYSKITGREYLELFRTPAQSRSIDEWNGLFKLPLDQITEGYSGGMKRKLALIGILRKGKQLVILDEPFNGLDIESSRLLSMIIFGLKEQGTTVIVTSHILGSLTGICDYIHLLKNGRIVFSKESSQFSNLESEIFSEVDSEHEKLVREILR